MAAIDMLVIGSGPAGRRAAVQSARLGKSVLVVDRGTRLGGVSVHTGTIPSKMLRQTVLNLPRGDGSGIGGQSTRIARDITAVDLMQSLHATLDQEVGQLQQQFQRNMVDSAFAEARFIDAHSAELTDAGGTRTRVEFDKALIATGTRPYRPENVPFDGKRVFDSHEILGLSRFPRTLTVIGGGVIGVEYATIFAAMDVPVTLIEARESILNFIDRDIVDDFVCQMRERGIVVRLGTQVRQVSVGATGVETGLSGGHCVKSDMLLFAAGRVGNIERLDLPAIGLNPDRRGRIEVNARTFQSAVPNIYAAGDVIGFPSLASASMEQGRIAACHAFDMPPPPPPECFPYGIYAIPEISTVGRTEQQVRAAGIAFECGVARFRDTSRGHIMGVSAGFLKLIFARDSRRLLGAHIVGEGATELIHIGQAVINLGGTVDFFVDNTFNHPTLAEAYKIAGLDAWNRMGEAAPLQVVEGRRA